MSPNAVRERMCAFSDSYSLPLVCLKIDPLDRSQLSPSQFRVDHSMKDEHNVTQGGVTPGRIGPSTANDGIFNAENSTGRAWWL